MKHILASQLTHGDANMATFFIPCNYSDRACHLHTRINMTTGSQEKTLHVWTELARKVIVAVCRSGKGQALPIPTSVYFYTEASGSPAPGRLLLIWPLPRHMDCYAIRGHCWSEQTDQTVRTDKELFLNLEITMKLRGFLAALDICRKMS